MSENEGLERLLKSAGLGATRNPQQVDCKGCNDTGMSISTDEQGIQRGGPCTRCTRGDEYRPPAATVSDPVDEQGPAQRELLPLGDVAPRESGIGDTRGSRRSGPAGGPTSSPYDVG